MDDKESIDNANIRKKLVSLFHENETSYIVFYLTIRIGTIPLVQTISFPFHLKWMDFFPDS